MQERWVQFLGWEDSLGGGNSNPLQFSCLRNLMRSLMDCSLWVKRESDITQSIQTHNTDSYLTIFWVYSKVMWYFHILYQGDFSIIDCVPCAVYYTVCYILYCQCEGKMCRSCSELCLQVIWITSPVTSLRTIHRVLLNPLEEDMDLANRHALPQNTDLFSFCKMIVYWASQYLAWNITFTINYIDIYTWSAGDTPVNCLFVHEFHGVLIHVPYTNFHLLVSFFSKCFWLWSFFELLNFMKLVLVKRTLNL